MKALFRGKQICNGEYIQGEAYFNDKGNLVVTNILPLTDGFENEFGTPYDPSNFKSRLGFSTKEGVVIFEGDILKMEDDKNIPLDDRLLKMTVEEFVRRSLNESDS